MQDDEFQQRFLSLVQGGLETLEQERDVFLTGAFHKIQGISDEKKLLLQRLEQAMPRLERSAEVLNAIDLLVRAGRRNEEIIKAAQQGLMHAKRRVESIRRAGRGVVAYAEDGSSISSHADLMASLRSA